MRHVPTPSENRLWQRLRNRKLNGLKFRRQHVIGRFIVDFYCAKARLVVELDGPVHEYTAEQDAIRQDFLEEQGLGVLQFTNAQIGESLDEAVRKITEMLKQTSPPGAGN